MSTSAKMSTQRGIAVLTATLKSMPEEAKLDALAYLVAVTMGVGTHPIIKALYVESAKVRKEIATKKEAKRKARRSSSPGSGGSGIELEGTHASSK